MRTFGLLCGCAFGTLMAGLGALATIELGWTCYAWWRRKRNKRC